MHADLVSNLLQAVLASGKERNIGASGREAWTPFVIHATELVNGVTSWKDKISKK